VSVCVRWSSDATASRTPSFQKPDPKIGAEKCFSDQLSDSQHFAWEESGKGKTGREHWKTWQIALKWVVLLFLLYVSAMPQVGNRIPT
jgi:hypothetical protein